MTLQNGRGRRERSALSPAPPLPHTVVFRQYAFSVLNSASGVIARICRSKNTDQFSM